MSYKIDLSKNEKTDLNNQNSSSHSEETESSTLLSNRKNRSLLISFLMGIITLGVWNRYRPINPQKRGGWGFTALFFFTILSCIYVKEYFRSEVNHAFQHVSSTDIELVSPSQRNLIEQENKNLISENDRLNDKLNLMYLQLEKHEKETINYRNLYEDSLENYSSVKSELEKIKNHPILVERIVKPEISLVSFDEINNEVGCGSPFSEQKKIDIFKDKYQGFWAKWKGRVSSSSNNSVLVSKEKGAGFLVDFENPGEGYSLLVGQEVTILIKIKEQGSCTVPFKGTGSLSLKAS